MPKLYPFSFFLGFAFGIFFYWLMGRVRPLLDQMRQSAKEQREASQIKRTSGLEDNHRRLTLRRAQGMHLVTKYGVRAGGTATCTAKMLRLSCAFAPCARSCAPGRERPTKAKHAT